MQCFHLRRVRDRWHRKHEHNGYQEAKQAILSVSQRNLL